MVAHRDDGYALPVDGDRSIRDEDHGVRFSAAKLVNRQSMTDAYAGIETANAQRYVFSDIENGGSAAIPRWGIYPAVTTTAVTIGKWPSLSVPLGTAPPVSATVLRTYHRYPTTAGTVDPVTGAVSYLLESYVLYQDGQRKYCKVSKVYRGQ